MAAIIKPDRVHVLADGAKCNMETGELTGVGSKINPLGRLNAIFVAAGPGMNATATFAMVCEEWDNDTFDGLVADLPDMMAFYQQHTGYFESDIVVAGFSEEKRRPLVASWHSRREPYRGMDPEKLYFHESGCVSFGLAAIAPTEDFEPSNHGIAAFDEARHDKLNLCFGLGGQVNLGYRIGGSLCHAELTAWGVKSAWLKHWPDRVGKPINPFTAAQMAMPL